MIYNQIKDGDLAKVSTLWVLSIYLIFLFIYLLFLPLIWTEIFNIKRHSASCRDQSVIYRSKTQPITPHAERLSEDITLLARIAHQRQSAGAGLFPFRVLPRVVFSLVFLPVNK